jgi:hypothetical protein
MHSLGPKVVIYRFKPAKRLCLGSRFIHFTIVRRGTVVFSGYASFFCLKISRFIFNIIFNEEENQCGKEEFLL